jgi:methionyl-tRNA formyltransferase
LSNYSYGILASGNLGLICLEAIYAKRGVIFVMTDKMSTSIAEFCSSHSIPVFIGNPRNGKAINFLSSYSADVLLSINYLFIIESDVIEFPKKFAVNFHGSLLPKYRGRSPHVWALINNETETGITAHLITSQCDEGDIIYQEKISIPPHITGGDILQQFFLRYPIVVSKVIDNIEEGNVSLFKQDETKATWFGKRSPEDGRINWSWQKERIHNWVRAQAKPYPGAFTYYNQEKVIIHSIDFCDHGFSYSDPDGRILEGGVQPVIKTPNGAVKLISIEVSKPIFFIKGGVLNERY